MSQRIKEIFEAGISFDEYSLRFAAASRLLAGVTLPVLTMLDICHAAALGKGAEQLEAERRRKDEV